MNKLAFARNLFFVTCATLGLAACGSSGSSSSAAAAGTGQSASVSTVHTTNTGMINRSPVASTASTSTVASSSKSTASGSTASTTTPVASTGTASSGTVAATTKVSNPVKLPTTGVATLDWTPPTENSDGSALTNLAGYVVYYGTSPSSLTQSIKVSNAGLTAYSLTDLPAGTWYFAITSVTTAGVESARSATVSTSI